MAIQTPEGPGYWAFTVCEDTSTNPPTRVSWRWSWVTDTPSLPGMAAEAATSLVLPLPTLSTSPTVGAPAIVGLPTWFWVPPEQWVPMAASVELLGVTVTATATPVELVVRTDRGESVTCLGPGRAYDFSISAAANGRSDCALLFQHSGTRTITASVRWSVAWSASTGEGAALDDVVRTSTTTQLVEQLQAVGVG